MTGNRCLGIVLLAAAGALAPGSTALSQATKVPGLVQEGNYAPGNLGMQMQPAPQNDDASAVYAVAPRPWSNVFESDRSGASWRQHFACALLLRQKDATTLVGSESAHTTRLLDQPRGLTRMCARRLRAQQASLCSVQTGRSLP